jgi:hypothetical protein
MAQLCLYGCSRRDFKQEANCIFYPKNKKKLVENVNRLKSCRGSALDIQRRTG